MGALSGAGLDHGSSGAPVLDCAGRVIGLVSKMMNLAERWGFRPDGSNPVRHVDKNREAKRERYLSPEDRRGCIDGADVDEDSRPEPERVPCLEAGPQRVLVARAARVVRPGGRVEPLARRGLEVGESHDGREVDRWIGGGRIRERGARIGGHGRQDR